MMGNSRTPSFHISLLSRPRLLVVTYLLLCRAPRLHMLNQRVLQRLVSSSCKTWPWRDSPIRRGTKATNQLCLTTNKHSQFCHSSSDLSVPFPVYPVRPWPEEAALGCLQQQHHSSWPGRVPPLPPLCCSTQRQALLLSLISGPRVRFQPRAARSSTPCPPPTHLPSRGAPPGPQTSLSATCTSLWKPSGRVRDGRNDEPECRKNLNFLGFS